MNNICKMLAWVVATQVALFAGVLVTDLVDRWRRGRTRT